jgi:hypothetical protein
VTPRDEAKKNQPRYVRTVVRRTLKMALRNARISASHQLPPVNQLVADESLQGRDPRRECRGLTKTSDGILARVESSNVGHAAAHYRENLPAICLLA